jgi:hypothetical protein
MAPTKAVFPMEARLHGSGARNLSQIIRIRERFLNIRRRNVHNSGRGVDMGKPVPGNVLLVSQLLITLNENLLVSRGNDIDCRRDSKGTLTTTEALLFVGSTPEGVVHFWRIVREGLSGEPSQRRNPWRHAEIDTAQKSFTRGGSWGSRYWLSALCGAVHTMEQTPRSIFARRCMHVNCFIS